MGEAVDFPEEMSAAARAAHARLGLTDTNLLRASLQMDFGEVGRRYLAAVRDLAGGQRYTIDKLPFNFRYCRPDPQGAAEGLDRAPDARSDGYLLRGLQDAVHQRVPLLLSARRARGVLHRLSPHDGSLACRHARRDARRALRRPGRRSADAVPAAARSTADCRGRTRCSTSIARRRPPRPRARCRCAGRSTSRPCRSGATIARELQPVLRRLAEAGLVDADGNPLR